jgi:hypothetical protein
MEREDADFSRKGGLVFPSHILDEPSSALAAGRVANSLSGPARASSIDKSAFAVDLIRRAHHRQLYAKAYGERARQEHVIDGEIVQFRNASVDFHAFLF